MLTPSFTEFITNLRKHCNAKFRFLIHNYIRLEEEELKEIIENRWALFRRFKGIIDIGTGDLNRTDLNQDLLNIYTEGGSQGCLIADAAQMQFLQALERALIHRRLTPPRALVHLIGRYEGHAHDNGIFQDLLNQITELNGKATP